METIKLDTGRKAFEVQRGEVITKWEYDVLTIKLECELLEKKHSLRNGDKMNPPTVEFLTDLAGVLSEFGLTDCTVDVAFRVYNVVTTQFNLMSADIEQQVATLVAST